jgi:hypothetical protein
MIINMVNIFLQLGLEKYMLSKHKSNQMDTSRE